MTKPVPGMWDTCSLCGYRCRLRDDGLCGVCRNNRRPDRRLHGTCPRCGRNRKRLGAPPPVCKDCARTLRRMVRNQTGTVDPYRPWFEEEEQQRRDHAGRELFDIECQRALDMGHDMGLVERDSEPGTYIARCFACHGWLVMDPAEYDDIGMTTPTPFYGRVYQTTCPGAPPVRLAPRRRIEDMAAANATVALEPLGVSAGGLATHHKKVWAWEMDESWA